MPFDDEDNDRRAWTPLIVVGVVIVALAIGLLVVSRSDDKGDQVTGTLPASFPTAATTAPPTTPPPTTAPVTEAPLTAPPVTIVPVRPDESDDGATTSAGGSADSDTALAELASQESATEVTGAVRIGSGLYAMLLVTGTGRLVKWSGTQWEDAATVDPPGIIDSVQTADVTGDGVPEFVIGLGGLDRPGGVYGQQNFSFDFLQFNTTNGLVDFVDGLELRIGQLESPFGGRTLIWTWTGRMFETR
jgi:hypothetical protein